MVLQHVAGRGLLVERLAQLAEQAGVLHGDHGLGGEGLQQRDLPFVERLHLLAIDRHDTDDGVVLA